MSALQSMPSNVHRQLEQIDILQNVLTQSLQAFEPKNTSLMALHLSDIADEMPKFQKNLAALVQSNGLTDDELAEIMADLQVSIDHIIDHGKELSNLLEEAMEVIS